MKHKYILQTKSFVKGMIASHKYNLQSQEVLIDRLQFKQDI